MIPKYKIYLADEIVYGNSVYKKVILITCRNWKKYGAFIDPTEEKEIFHNFEDVQLLKSLMKEKKIIPITEVSDNLKCFIGLFIAVHYEKNESGDLTFNECASYLWRFLQMNKISFNK